MPNTQKRAVRTIPHAVRLNITDITEIDTTLKKYSPDVLYSFCSNPDYYEGRTWEELLQLADTLSIKELSGITIEAPSLDFEIHIAGYTPIYFFYSYKLEGLSDELIRILSKHTSPLLQIDARAIIPIPIICTAVFFLAHTVLPAASPLRWDISAASMLVLLAVALGTLVRLIYSSQSHIYLHTYKISFFWKRYYLSEKIVNKLLDIGIGIIGTLLWMYFFW